MIRTAFARLCMLVWSAALVACVSAKSDDVDPAPLKLEAAPAKAPAAINSVKDWDGLDKDFRRDLMDGETKRYSNLTLTQPVALAAVTDAAQKAFAEKMAAYMRNNGDMNVEDASHAKVGPVETTVQFLLLGGKDIVGGHIRFAQQGCDMPDESAPTFPTKQAAEKAGCETGAGGWRAEGSFNHDAVPLEYGDYMEWTGQDAPAGSLE